MVVTRRSNKATRKCVALSTPKQEKKSGSVKRKKVQRGAVKELRKQELERQQDVQRGAQEEQQEDEGHENEAEVEIMGGEEIMPLDISSDEEETNPQIDHSLMLISVSKPPSHVETSEKNLEILMAAAIVLKGELVSHLVKTAHKLDIADMVRSANKCFIGLESLKVDYGAFHGEVRNLIKYSQELKEVNEKNTCPDLGLKVAHEKSMSDVNDAREKLGNAERNLINAQTDYKSTMQRIEKVIDETHRLKELADEERKGIENLANKRDHDDEVLSLADRYEKIQRALSRLQDLV